MENIYTLEKYIRDTQLLERLSHVNTYKLLLQTYKETKRDSKCCVPFVDCYEPEPNEFYDVGIFYATINKYKSKYVKALVCMECKTRCRIPGGMVCAVYLPEDINTIDIKIGTYRIPMTFNATPEKSLEEILKQSHTLPHSSITPTVLDSPESFKIHGVVYVRREIFFPMLCRIQSSVYIITQIPITLYVEMIFGGDSEMNFNNYWYSFYLPFADFSSTKLFIECRNLADIKECSTDYTDDIDDYTDYNTDDYTDYKWIPHEKTSIYMKKQ